VGADLGLGGGPSAGDNKQKDVRLLLDTDVLRTAAGDRSTGRSGDGRQGRTVVTYRSGYAMIFLLEGRRGDYLGVEWR
jgi:hypothetical protein